MHEPFSLKSVQTWILTYKITLLMYMRYFILLALIAISTWSNATVTVTPANRGICIPTAAFQYQPIGNIIIKEGNTGDLPIQSGTTLVLTAPTGFTFQVNTGSVQVTASQNISSASLSVTLTTITLTLTVTGTNKIDSITIIGVNARATGANLTGNILRKSPGGGTAGLTGDAPGGGVNHGTLFSQGSGATITSIANGNWNSTSTWSGGKIPLCYDNVVISNNVTVNAAIQNINNLTVNSGAQLKADSSVMVNGVFTLAAGASYIHNNTDDPATTIFKGTEVIDPASTITVKRWVGSHVPFCTSISGNVGNLVLDYNATWDQDGLFAPSRIKGTFTVTDGQIIMDDGTGATTSLTLNDVNIYLDGSIIFAKGPNRNLTISTGNFADSSTSAALTAFMYATYGNLVWNCNGNAYFSHDFSAVQGFAGSNTANINATINGNLTAVKGRIDFGLYINGNVNLTVTGNTSIAMPATSWFTLANYNTANVTFTTNNLDISSNTFTYLQGSLGASTFNIQNDFTYSSNFAFVFANLSTNTATQTINIGRDMIISSGSVGFAYTSGTLNTTISRDLILIGASTFLVGQFYPYSNAASNLTITRNCSLTSGELNGVWNQGILNFNNNGIMSCNNATFEGTFYPFFGNYKAATFNINQLDFNGGTFYLFDSYINDGKTITANFGSIDLNFASANDRVVFINNTGNGNNPLLNLSITGNVDIAGNASGIFASNLGAGNETVSIGGNVNIASGINSFVGSTNLTSVGHSINSVVSGNVNIMGGATYLSVLNGTTTSKINGNLTITGGNLFLKRDVGNATLKITGDYTQSNGTFTIHGDTVVTPNADSVIVSGNFSQTGGTFNFDNTKANSGLGTHTLVINGSSYTIGGVGIIKHANHLTSNTIFGQIIFNAPSTTTYSRTSGTHDLQQVKMIVGTANTLNASASAQALQIASHQDNTAAVHNTLTIYGALEMGTQQILAKQQANYYAQLTVNSGGKIKTQHTGGLYSGSAIASCINPMIVGNNRMNYFLDPNSTIQYKGVDNQVITGIPNGIATLTQHKYGKLEINFGGTANSEWVCAEADSEVFVRTQLILTTGELNLDNDHVTATGGRSINIENGATISRTSGYIRSEVENGTGILNWNITANGSYIVPFGYNSSSYIPFTYQQLASSSGWVKFGTFHTIASNLPYPPSVTQINSIAGSNNSSNTVDRFWYINTANNPSASLTFTASAAETGSIISMRAQRWMPTPKAWEASKGTQSNPSSTSTLVASISGLNHWWTLSAGSSPLPVELLAFDGECDDKNINIKWSTASQLNNDFFILEHSKNGENWEILTHVKGEGTTNSLSHYEVVDDEPVVGVNYYRLTQVDYDGKRVELKTIAVKKCNSAPLNIIHQAFEGNEIALKVYSDYNDILEINIFDNNGKLLARKMQNTGIGINDIHIQTTTNATGIYVLKVKNSFSNISKKIIKF